MAGSECTNCEAALAAGWQLCHTCTSLLEYLLERVFDVYGTIQTTLERRDVGAASMGGGGAAGSVEPVNLDVLDHTITLQAVLNGWATHIPAMRPASHEPHIVAGWMLQPATMNHIRHADWTATLIDELESALQPLAHSAERAAPKAFAGMCPAPATHDDSLECGTPLYTRPGNRTVRCRQCTNTFDVTDWRARALEAAGHHAGTPAEVSRMVSNPVTGEALPAATIRSWVRRGKLTPLDHNTLGKPVYQVRKVRALWARSMAATYTRRLTTRDETGLAA